MEGERDGWKEERVKKSEGIERGREKERDGTKEMVKEGEDREGEKEGR